MLGGQVDTFHTVMPDVGSVIKASIMRSANSSRMLYALSYLRRPCWLLEKVSITIPAITI